MNSYPRLRLVKENLTEARGNQVCWLFIGKDLSRTRRSASGVQFTQTAKRIQRLDHPQWLTFELCGSKALTEKIIQPRGSLFLIPAV